MSISAPFLLMSPGVDQPLPPVLVCVSVLYVEAQVGLFTPLRYSGSFLVVLLIVVVGNSILIIGAATTSRVHNYNSIFFSRSVLEFCYYINELLFAYLLNVLSLLGSYHRTCPMFAFN